MSGEGRNNVRTKKTREGGVEVVRKGVDNRSKCYSKQLLTAELSLRFVVCCHFGSYDNYALDFFAS